MTSNSPLRDHEILEALERRPQWAYVDGSLVLERHGLAYEVIAGWVASIAALAIELDHHPEICFGYNSLRVSLRTHDQQGITTKDFECADRILTLLA
ncbi:MAG: 4a-hydroxytetrahydrobiopterin dehydratase [Burkholderiaceae bacterium]